MSNKLCSINPPGLRLALLHAVYRLDLLEEYIFRYTPGNTTNGNIFISCIYGTLPTLYPLSRKAYVLLHVILVTDQDYKILNKSRTYFCDVVDV